LPGLIIKKISTLIFLLLCIFILNNCNREDAETESDVGVKGFKWSEEIKLEDIPDEPVRGFLNGSEINLTYINFEQWRGSGDNVLNFGNKAPRQNCGYVEGDDAFHLMHIAGEINEGEFLKSSFSQQMDEYVAYFHYTDENNDMKKITVPWNCALIITSMEEEIVRGKIAMCFNDNNRSWIAGTFEAVYCFN
jgi:hypothetical protein